MGEEDTVLASRVYGKGFIIGVEIFMVEGLKGILGFGVWGLGFRVKGLGFRA